MKESLIETLIDLPLELTMKLVSSLTNIFLKSPVYDPLQIFLEET